MRKLNMNEAMEHVSHTRNGYCSGCALRRGVLVMLPALANDPIDARMSHEEATSGARPLMTTRSTINGSSTADDRELGPIDCPMDR